MATITFKGSEIHTSGSLPDVGAAAPAFVLTASDLSEVSGPEVGGKKHVLNIFPSLDTSVCAASVRRFNEEAAGMGNASVLCISMDLPFAQARFCGAEGLENVTTLSAFRHSEFGSNYGVDIVDGPLAGLLARAVVVVNEKGEVVHTELVQEIAQEPDYECALKAL